MERTLADARAEVLERYAILLRSGNPQGQSVFIIYGCECLEGGGKETPYHVHTLHASQLDGWWRMQNGSPIAAYNPTPELKAR